MAAIAASTEVLYAARIKSLAARRPRLSLRDAGPWVRELERRRLSLSSLKSYASAVRFHARERLAEPAGFLDAFDALLRPVQAAARKARRRRRPAISAPVMAGLRQAALYRDGQSAFTSAVVDLAEGSWRFGLRPCEWAQCSVRDGALVVRNGKFLRRRMAHGIFAGRFFSRANGRFRTLEPTGGSLSGPDGELVSRIRSFQTTRPYERHRRAVQAEFRKVVRIAVGRKLVPARYRDLTLYSFRHQFASDAKAVTPAASGAIAAMMGHISVRTALQSYGRRSAGSGRPLRIAASRESVAAVENRAVFERSFVDGRPVHSRTSNGRNGEERRDDPPSPAQERNANASGDRRGAGVPGGLTAPRPTGR